MTIEEQIRSYIVETFLLDDGSELTFSMSLFESGILDSTGGIELVMFLEEKFGIKVDNKDLVPENLASIDNIALFVRRKLECRSAED